MSAERCPDCGAVRDDCRCESLRIRPYVSLPDPGQASAPPQALTRPVPRAATEAHTPAYGTPVASWPDETIQLRAVPASGPAPGEAGARRRIRVLPIAAAVAVVATAALAVTAFSGSGKPDTETVLLDVKPTAPLSGLPSAAPASTSASAKPSPSLSRSPSASRSASPSPTPTPGQTRSSAPAATPSPTPSRPSSPPPPSQAPTLQYGDSGPEVEKLQRLLSAQGLYRGKFDGKFGGQTRSAVSTFQWENGIEGDPYGVYGPETRRALEG